MASESVEYVKDFDRRIRHSVKGMHNSLKGTLAPPLTTAVPTPGLGLDVDGRPVQWEDAVKRVRVAVYGAVEGARDAVKAALRGPSVEIHREAVHQAGVATGMQANVPTLGTGVVVEPPGQA